MNDIFKDDFRFPCRRQNCIYNNNSKCDKWDIIFFPKDVSKCEDYHEENEEY